MVPPKFVSKGPGVYETPDGRITMYRLEGVRPPAWNVEWTTDYAYAMEERHFGEEDLQASIVDGAGSKKDAEALFREAWPETRRKIERLEGGAMGSGIAPVEEIGGALTRTITYERHGQRWTTPVDVALAPHLQRALDAGFMTSASHSGIGRVLGLVKGMAFELGPLGIRANAVCPGTVRTPATEVELRDPAAEEMQTRACPIGRIGLPTDIAEAVAFLADWNRAGWITGEALLVDGGFGTHGEGADFGEESDSVVR